MLDKRTLRYLGVFAKICDDGSYKIIEKAELLKECKGIDTNVLNQMVRFLQDNEMIDVKYSDETVYCLTVLPKGRVAVESVKRNVREAIKLDKRTLLVLLGGVLVASFIGGLIGGLIAGLC